ncbi:MAG: hypothetical protein KGS61_20295 [Verrucomicrobia bacterium]|nr:hypothetical protein [Verrucomicrobiota bacterium]
MKRGNTLQQRWLGGAGRLALAAALMCAVSTTGVLAADAKPDKDAPPAKKTEKKTASKSPKKKLTGADLYAINCNRCHPERYATEWTAAQWRTIMMHMRVRANLPASQARIILKYLQEDSGN